MLKNVKKKIAYITCEKVQASFVRDFQKLHNCRSQTE